MVRPAWHVRILRSGGGRGYGDRKRYLQAFLVEDDIIVVYRVGLYLNFKRVSLWTKVDLGNSKCVGVYMSCCVFYVNLVVISLYIMPLRYFCFRVYREGGARCVFCVLCVRLRGCCFLWVLPRETGTDTSKMQDNGKRNRFEEE